MVQLKPTSFRLRYSYRCRGASIESITYLAKDIRMSKYRFFYFLWEIRVIVPLVRAPPFGEVVGKAADVDDDGVKLGRYFLKRTNI